jgi:hypothetical protein
MKTAVEWLVDKLKSQGLLIGEPNNLVAVRQAKEMEKEQIRDAYTQGADDEYEFHTNPHLMKREDVDAEEYYNETFKQQEQ